MDNKLHLDLNQFLRFLLAGGWALGCFLFINPHQFENLFKEHTIDLILIAMVFGSIVYVVHRAVLYPNLHKVICIILSIFKKMKWDSGYLMPFFPSKTEMELDLMRWALRKNEKSISKNITDWAAQVHFLYCSAFASLFTVIISYQMEDPNVQRLLFVRCLFWLLLVFGLINDIRLVLYDLKVINKERDLL